MEMAAGEEVDHWKGNMENRKNAINAKSDFNFTGFSKKRKGKIFWIGCKIINSGNNKKTLAVKNTKRL